jgi:hypothetical protein
LERVEANRELVNKIEENRWKRIEEAEQRIQEREIWSITAQHDEHKKRNLENENVMAKRQQLPVAREHEQKLLEKKRRDFDEREKRNQEKAEQEKPARITAFANTEREYNATSRRKWESKRRQRGRSASPRWRRLGGG